MKCPHCLIEFHEQFKSDTVGQDIEGGWKFKHTTCPSCQRIVILLQVGDPQWSAQYTNRIVGWNAEPRTFMVHPRGHARRPCPTEVPKAIAEEYQEACIVLADSPKASAALSRRCLQHVLTTQGGVKSHDLYKQIDEVLGAGRIPSHIGEMLDAVRTVGNFAAHPVKSTATGAIVDVEPHEAELNLDVLESLFDFYYVQPAIMKRKKDALNQKLKDAGKKPI